MTRQERQLLGSRLFSLLYPRGNFYRLDTESMEKYIKGAEKFADYVATDFLHRFKDQVIKECEEAKEENG